MMSSPKTPAPAPVVGNVDSKQVATNEQAIPLPYFGGRTWLPIIWAQSNIYNPKTKAVTTKVGKSKQTTGYDYYGSLVGVLGCCLLDYLEGIEVAGKLAWSGGIVRDGAHLHHTGDIVVDGVGTFRLHWGTPDAPANDNLVLAYDAVTGLPYAEVIVGGVPTREYHSAYRRMPWVEALDCYFGNNNATPPTIRFLVERAARFPGLPEDRTREGTNPVTLIAELMGDDFYGLGMPEIVHVPSALATANAVRRDTPVAVPGDAGHIAAMGFLSPVLDRQQPAQSFFARVMEYYDGWVRPFEGQLFFGRFPHDGVTPVGLPELSYHDFIAGKRPRFEPVDNELSSLITEVNIAHLDRDGVNGEIEKALTPVPNPAARRRLGFSNPKTFQRPFIITTYQALEQGNQLARLYSRDEEGCEASVRREKAVGLHAGDLFVLTDAPSASSQVVRILQRTDPSDGGEVQFSLVLERGLAPLAYVPPPNPRPTLPDPDLVAIVNARIFQLPTLFDHELLGDDPAVVVLAQRPGAHVTGYTTHFSTDNVSYDQVAEDGRWSLRGTLAAAALAGDAMFTINASGFELALLAAQTNAARDDDTLLLFIGYELCSIGNVVALGGGQYQVSVLRGRRGSAATGYANGTALYIVPRDNLQILQNANFPRAIANRHFKLATYTINRGGGEEQELADALYILFAFDDTNCPSPAPLTATPKAEAIFLAWVYPAPPADKQILGTDIWERDTAVPAPVPGVDAPSFQLRATGFNRGGLTAGATKYYWVQNRDTIGRSTLVGPISATALAAATGPMGPTGPTGDTGPGIVYRGDYDAAKTYYDTATRRDVVKYSGAYYLTNNLAKSGTATWGVPTGGDWAAFGASFSSIATGLLLAEDATILKTLVMGDGSTSDAGVIRSNGASSFGVGTGFWLGNDGVIPKFRIGDPSGNVIQWDGTKFTIQNGTGLNAFSLDDTHLGYGNMELTQWAGGLGAGTQQQFTSGAHHVAFGAYNFGGDTAFLELNGPSFKKVGAYSSGLLKANSLDIGSDGATFASQLQAPNGTAGNPAYSFTSHSDSGMRDRGDGSLGFSVGGTERLIVRNGATVILDDLKLNKNVGSLGLLSVTGYIDIQDSSGATVHLAVLT